VNALKRILDRVPRPPRRIVLSEAADPRILAAAARLVADGIVAPLLLGEPGEVASAATSLGLDLGEVVIEDPATHPKRERYRDELRAALDDAAECERLLDDPLYFAAAMVRAGDAHGSVSGATRTTADTVRAALRVLGPAPGTRLVSSLFVMGLREPTPAGDDLLAFADCGLVPEPSADDLADIAVRTAESFHTLTGLPPRVALLSFSTAGSARHDAVERVRAARDRLAELAPDFPFDGELQLDAALVPEIQAAKAPGSIIAGRANVLIFPSLDAGNIGYKLVERLAGARAIGPILQGLRRPANDLSRGCTVEDVVVAAAVTALQG
jgi:phosphate acetyltransferase